MFDFKLWSKGLVAAAIGGAATSATSALADPSMLSNPKGMVTMAGVGAALGGLAYLKTHPPVDAVPDLYEPMAAAGVGVVADLAAKRLQKKP